MPSIATPTVCARRLQQVACYAGLRDRAHDRRSRGGGAGKEARAVQIQARINVSATWSTLRVDVRMCQGWRMRTRRRLHKQRQPVEKRLKRLMMRNHSSAGPAVQSSYQRDRNVNGIYEIWKRGRKIKYLKSLSFYLSNSPVSFLVLASCHFIHRNP